MHRADHSMTPARVAWRSSRWVPVIGGMMLQICGGSIYITSLYSSDLKGRFFAGAEGQAQIEQLVFACNLGNWLPAAGFFNDSPIGGASRTAVMAAVMTLAGYLGVWAWSAELIHPPYWQVWIFWFLWGHGSGWFDNAAMTTTAKNFPRQRGRAMALMKAFYGLSGSMLTQVYDLFFFGRTSAFLLFLGIGLSAGGALCAPLLWLVPMSREERDEPEKRFHLGLRLVLGLASFLLAVSMLRELWGMSVAINATSFVVTLLAVCSLVLLAHGSAIEGPAQLFTIADDPYAGAPADGAFPSFGLGDAARQADFWFLFLVVFTGMGSGLVVLNHVGQMVTALGGSENATAILVSLISIANCFGRIAFGVVPDALGAVPRPLFCAINLAIMACAQLLLAIGAMPTLCAGAVVAGFSYGGFWTLMPSLVSELFGTRNFATLYNCQSLAVSCASLTFSTIVASSLYDRQAVQHPTAKGRGCEGSTCYRTISLIMVAACCVGIASAAALHFLDRRRRELRSLQGCAGR